MESQPQNPDSGIILKTFKHVMTYEVEIDCFGDKL